MPILRGLTPSFGGVIPNLHGLTTQPPELYRSKSKFPDFRLKWFLHLPFPYMSQSLRLVDQIRAVARMEHLSLRTEASYLAYIKEFFLFHNKQHPRDLGVPEIRAYLSHLAVDRHVAASTQNVALCALLFLYRRVLKIDLPNIDSNAAPCCYLYFKAYQRVSKVTCSHTTLLVSGYQVLKLSTNRVLQSVALGFMGGVSVLRSLIVEPAVLIGYCSVASALSCEPSHLHKHGTDCVRSRYIEA